MDVRSPKRSRTAGWVAAALAAVLAGVVLVGFGARTEPTRRLATGVNEFVNPPSGPVAHNSPTVVQHPSDPAVVIMANRLDAPEFGCAVWVSTTAGSTWRPLELTPALAARNCFWPRPAFDGDGNLLILYTPLGGPNILPVSLWLQRYDADLRAAGDPLQLAGELAFHARLAVAGPQVWVSWVQAGPATVENQLGFAPGDNHIVVARSDDGGRRFQRPVRVSSPDLRVIQPTVLATGDGGLFVGALDLVDDLANYEALHDGETPPDPALRWRIVGWTSDDGGATFAGPSVVAADLPVPQLLIADLGPTPGFARDAASGRLYATWDAGRGDARDVQLASSTDGGRSWTPPTRLGPASGSQHLPAVAVGPGGRVDVAFYDRSADPDDVRAHVVLATSWDGGATHQVVQVSDADLDTRIGLGMQQGVPLLGDHLALASLEGQTVVFWADTNRGLALARNVQDLAVAVVRVEQGQRRAVVALAGGVALLAVGAACAGLAVRQRRAAPSPR